MAIVYWSADGAGKVGGVPAALFAWMRANGAPEMIIYGGDVYNHGKPKDFKKFFAQLAENVLGVCETAGNHDWMVTDAAADTGEIPLAYEAFWSQFPPPASHQPIDVTKRGGARYEHFRDVAGWRLVFLDTGPCADRPWPMGDDARIDWLRQTLHDGPGRSQIVFAHHSRLSSGKHGDNPGVDTLWRTLFDPATGRPLAALTVAGHDHNVSIYGPRPQLNPERGAVAFADGIHLMVNGAGGEGHDTGFRGTKPDLFFDDDHFCMTRFTFLSARAVDVDVLSFGKNDPPTKADPQVVTTLEIRI